MLKAQLAPGTKNVLIVTNGTKEALTGVGCFFLRLNGKPITLQNVYTDVYFGKISGNILPSLTVLVKNVILPSLRAQVKLTSNMQTVTYHKL